MKVAYFILVIFSILVGALALMLLWGWFVVPLGVPRIGFWHAAGLNVLVNRNLSAVVNWKDFEHWTIEDKFIAAFGSTGISVLAIVLGWSMHVLGAAGVQ